MSRSAAFKIDERNSRDENNAVGNVYLLYTTLLDLSTSQLQYCYYYIWEKKRV